MIQTPAPAAEAGAPADDAPAPRYRVDPEWYAAQNLSFEEVVRARMDDESRAKLGSAQEERVPVFDKSTGRMQIKSERATFGADPLKVIQDVSGQQRNYITRDMPTLEAVFRVILAGGNQPMTLEDVRERLVEWCPGGGCQWLLLPLETIDRLVRTDKHYGLVQVAE